MQRVANTFSAEFLCVMQPTRDWVVKGDDKKYYVFRGESKAFMTREGVAFVDINDHAEKFTGEMFMDDLHLDATGNRILASILVTEIGERGLL